MGIRKQMAVLFLCAGCLMGCTTQGDSTPATQGNGHTESGLKQMDMGELETKIKAKDEFLVMITQSTCSHCITMKRTLLPYFRQHSDIPFYEIEMDMLGDKVADTNTNFTKLQTLVPSFSGATPEYLYFKDGTLQKQKSGEMSEIAWNNFMIECGFVKGKEQKEETTVYTLADSKNFKEITISEIAKKLEKKEDFYFYFAAEDRYNAMFSKTLKKYAEDRKITIYVLNNSKVSQPASEKENEEMNEAVETINKAMTIELAPSVFHIEKGKAKDTLKDNADAKELQEWFEKQ